ncbi:MAG: NFACT family protein [Clostridiales bacterium]|nr:NFACT family protein [Clostridiales bacterium]
MPQDAFTIKYVTKELNEALTGGKISKITQTDRDSLTFIVYTQKGSVKLDICLSARACRISLTDSDKPVPQVAPGFCMLLRKHLANAQITAISQLKYERVVMIDFDCTSEFEHLKMRLYVELMGKYSNAVLTQDNIILGALKSTAIGENTKRVLFSGVKYTLPEPQDKISPDDLPALNAAFEYAAGDMAKFISEKVKGIAYSTALDIVETYGENLSAKDVNSYICGGQCNPCVTYSEGEPTDFKVRCSSPDRRDYSTVLEAQKAYYDYLYKKQIFEEAKKKLLAAVNGAVKKLEKRLQTINQKLLDCKDADDIKLKGELITANIYAISRGMDCFEAVNYYDEKGGKIKIALDKTLSPSQNAQKYYKRYAKLKRTQETVSAQRGETEDRLSYLNSITAHICAADGISDLEEISEELKQIGLIKEIAKGKKQKPKITPFRTYDIAGFKVLAGRNNIQNDRLLKTVSGGDMWLHTQGYHSSHVAILCEGRDVPEKVLLAAAEICAYYSDGRNGTKIPVDYTRRKFVKKPPASNAGFVIYTDYKTILVEPASHAKENTEEL